MRYFRLIVLAILICQGCSQDKVTGPDPLLPTITEVTPAQLSRGGNNINGRIKGTNFSSDAQVDMGQGISIRNVNIRSTTEIAVNFDVAANATVGSRNVTVTTPAGSSTPFQIQVGENRFPVASFSVNPPSGSLDTTFTFDASGSSDPDGSISAYDWDFDDGHSATGRIVTHQFTAQGSFRVVLRVRDNQNAIDRHTHDLRIDPQSNQAPEARFILSPKEGDPSTTFRFDGTPSRDPDGNIDMYSWDFGDGASARGRIVQHKYIEANIYTARLTVKDDDGIASSDEKSVDVRGGGGGTAPVAQFTVTPTSGNLNTVFALDASASVDPDGTIVTYEWTMGDGSTRQGQTTQHKYVSRGTYSIKLTVTDNSGEKNSLIRDVTVQ